MKYTVAIQKMKWNNSCTGKNYNNHINKSFPISLGKTQYSLPVGILTLRWKIGFNTSKKQPVGRKCMKMSMVVFFYYEAVRLFIDETYFIFERYLLDGYSKILMLINIKALPKLFSALNEVHRFQPQ